MTHLAMTETKVDIARFSKEHGGPISGWQPHSIIPIQDCEARQQMYDE